MYFSARQIEQSLLQLGQLNPFFGISFLAFKKAGLPVGSTKSIDFKHIVGNILQAYYRPTPDHRGYYSPFKQIDKRDCWTTLRCSVTTLQRIANEMFADTLIHSPENREWGWRSDYIETLKNVHLTNGLIPAFDLAVWIFRLKPWDDDPVVYGDSVIEYLFNKFDITQEERALFDTTIPPLASPCLQNRPITYKALLEVIGLPSNEFVKEGARLESLKLMEVGPASQIELELAPRLNIITGDNGLGKTFLLECAWWALTGTWANYPAHPHQSSARRAPNISFRIGEKHRSNKVQTARYLWEHQEWTPVTKRDVLPGLSIYSQADGSFAVWDPAKHLLMSENRDTYVASPLTTFSRLQVWDGIEEASTVPKVGGKGNGTRTKVVCNGLIRDWITWQNSADKSSFEEFSAAIQMLSPHISEPLIPGKPARMIGEAREIPTLKFSYGEVPIIHCSAGIQRIVALAYLLVWAWHEHVVTSEIMHREPHRSIVLLIDEMEAHLHPFWQRAIVPALMEVVRTLANQVQTQMILATHSPLVLASVETHFDEERDNLFHLYLDNGQVILERIDFVKRGRADQWLISDVFGLKQPRSKVAEEVIEEAKLLQLAVTPATADVERVHQRLADVLSPDDEFWPRWKYFAELRGVTS